MRVREPSLEEGDAPDSPSWRLVKAPAVAFIEDD
jgi:hypothetical protein